MARSGFPSPVAVSLCGLLSSPGVSMRITMGVTVQSWTMEVVGEGGEATTDSGSLAHQPKQERVGGTIHRRQSVRGGTAQPSTQRHQSFHLILFCIHYLFTLTSRCGPCTRDSIASTRPYTCQSYTSGLWAAQRAKGWTARHPS